MNKSNLIAVFLLSFFVLCCEKGDLNVGNGVELYLLDYWETINDTNFIDSSSVVAQRTPFIYYSDIISYDPSDYTFEMSDRVYRIFMHITEWDDDFLGQPFILRVDGVNIYLGRFWVEYYQSVAGDTGLYALKEKNKFQARIFKSSSDIIAVDKRNDPRIINVMKRDGKLVK